MFVLLSFAVAVNILLLAFFKSVDQFSAFSIWLAIFILVNFSIARYISKKLKFSFKAFIRQYWKGLILTFLIAFLPRVLLLGIYPHVSIFDELRDAGLLAQRFSANNPTEIFGFGSYQGYGNFVPLSAFYFLKIFGASFLSYTVPAALYGTVAICLLYLAIAPIKGVKFAVITAALTSVVLSNLQFSRTEICIITDSFLAMLIFIAYLITLKTKWGFFILGSVAGLTWHFYAGSRLILLCFLIIIFFVELKKLFTSLVLKKNRQAIMRGLQITGLFLIGLFISLGPTILYLKQETFFSGNGVNLLLFNQPEFVGLSVWEKIVKLVQTYLFAFGTYTFVPVKYYYFNAYPYALLTFPVNLFFLLGVVVAFFKSKGRVIKSVLFVVLLFPFLSQVLANQVGYIHRQQGIVGFINIIACVGLFYFFEKLLLKFKWKQIFMVVLIALFYISQLVIFFGTRLVDVPYQKRSPEAYVFQRILFDIAQEEVSGTEYFILDQLPYNIGALHYKEKAQYLTSPRRVSIVQMDRFIAKLNLAATGKIKQRQVFFLLDKKQIDDEWFQNGREFKEKIYHCQERHFGILYDCPNNMSEYTYYYYEVN